MHSVLSSSAQRKLRCGFSVQMKLSAAASELVCRPNVSVDARRN